MFKQLILLLGLIVAPAHADQSDPGLEKLFEMLNLPLAERDAGLVINQIWRIWKHGDSDIINVLMKVGEKQMSSGQLDHAVVTFSKIIDEYPDFSEGWNKRAMVYYMLGMNELSMQDVEHTLAREPRHFGALSGMGMIFMRQERMQDAIAAFEAALSINPYLTDTRELIETLKQLQKKNTI